MGMVCKICRYDELTRDELYDIIQMRIEGFIVRNNCIYQDMETYYDQCGMYVMIGKVIVDYQAFLPAQVC